MKKKKLIKHTRKVLEYLWHDEKKHFLESGKPKKKHIFIDLNKIKKLLKKSNNKS